MFVSESCVRKRAKSVDAGQPTSTSLPDHGPYYSRGPAKGKPMISL